MGLENAELQVASFEVTSWLNLSRRKCRTKEGRKEREGKKEKKGKEE